MEVLASLALVVHFIPVITCNQSSYGHDVVAFLGTSDRQGRGSAQQPEEPLEALARPPTETSVSICSDDDCEFSRRPNADRPE